MKVSKNIKRKQKLKAKKARTKTHETLMRKHQQNKYQKQVEAYIKAQLENKIELENTNLIEDVLIEDTSVNN